MKTGILAALFSFSVANVAVAIEVGAQAPQFSAKNQDGKTVHLSDFKGQAVLLYFYPKDDTPGCTKEACQLRDQFEDFKKQKAAVLGVSKQDQKSHVEFRKKHKLPFDLLVDTDGSLATAYGIETVPGLGFHHRQSVLIGRDGLVIKFYKDVKPDEHATQVLNDLKAAEAKKN